MGNIFSLPRFLLYWVLQYISVMLYKEWQISRRSDIASTTIVIQEGVTPDDLSDKSRIDSAEDAQLNNSSETQNNDNNNNTDTEE